MFVKRLRQRVASVAAISPERETHGMAITWAGRPSSSAERNWGLARTRDVRDVERIEFLDGVGATEGGGKVVVADQQQGADAGLREADDALAPFALEGGCRGAVLVGIPGKDDQVHFFGDGRLDDGIQGLEEIQHAQRQARFGVVAAIIGHVDVRVGEMQEFHS